MEKTIRFQGMESLQEFLAVVSAMPEQMELCSKDEVVNAKSAMGILSLDWSCPLKLRFEAGTKRSREICDAIRCYLVD